MDNEKKFEMKNEIKRQFKPYNFNSGQIERLEDRIDKLETALSHCIVFIADRLRLSDEEINGENGITDF